jgi:CDP-paratose 2-epimerase
MSTKHVLITGGAGFIGCNAARYFGQRNWQVTVLDNLSRVGTESNLTWLRDETEFEFAKADVRDTAAVNKVISETKPDAIIHLAAQVAVTTSVTDPRMDFDVNALGTFNLLDAVRRFRPDTPFLFASTNKVYGKITGATSELRGNRYAYTNRPHGIPESEPLDFLSPYGCSKGAADQYVLDFARIYGIPAASFRQSCIYGPRQFGVEDQGWVAWFAIATLLEKNITIYGDGKQVRDVLHVDDAIRAYEAAIRSPDDIRGQAFNIGGGTEQTLSLLELIDMLEKHYKRKIPLKFDQWRPGDQEVYVSDVRKLEKLLSWKPAIDAKQGVGKLIEWVEQNRSAF